MVTLSNLFLGRFERYLDFVIALRQLYGLPQSATAAEKRSVLTSVHAKFFACPAKERLAITSQVRSRRTNNRDSTVIPEPRFNRFFTVNHG